MRILIKGAGIIGLSIGWRLLREGFEVEIFDRGEAGHGASWAAAGMLGPYAEAHFEDTELLSLCQQSLSLYPQFLNDLSSDANLPLSFESQGTLFVGIDGDDRRRLERMAADKLAKNYPVEWISPDTARQLEPLLTPRISSAFYLPTELQIDNRRLIFALVAAFRKRGGTLHEYTLFPINPPALVINASGANADPRIRPNKGQILTLQTPPPLALSRVVRSPRIYLVPKSGGILRVGATNEEVGFDVSLKALAIRELLNNAAEIIPAIDEMALIETIAAFRPATVDRLPLIEEQDDGSILAAGHGRAGILLAPYTAATVVKMLKNAWLYPTSPAKRFSLLHPKNDAFLGTPFANSMNRDSKGFCLLVGARGQSLIFGDSYGNSI